MTAANRLSRIFPLLLALAGSAVPPSAGAQEEEAPARQDAGSLRGHVRAADGGPVAGVRVHLRTGAFADSAVVDSGGGFSLRVPAGRAGDTVEVRAEAADSLAGRYHPSLARVSRAEATGREHGFVLVPREWAIAAGSHAGRRVELNVEAAFQRACAGCSAFWLRYGPAGGDTSRRTVRGWPERSFPLRVAFDRDNSGNDVSRRDSVAFWRIAERVDAAFGERLFRPAPYAATLGPEGGDAPEDVVLVWIEPSLPYSGLGTTGGTAGDITFGSVWLQRASQIASPDGPQIVAHELVHTLGFGHTCAWRSVLADSSRCRGLQTEEPTPEDVAHVQVFRRVRALQREHGARFGLEAALAAITAKADSSRAVPRP